MTITDVDFIMELTIDDAKNGHLNKEVLYPSNIANHRQMLINLINGIGSVILTGTGKREQRNAAVYVCKHATYGNIGFIHIIERYEGSGDDEIEALSVSIKKEYRGLGYGRKIIEWFINETPRTANLYARCLVNSEIMCNLLLNKGFSVLSESQSGTKTFELKNSNKPSYFTNNAEITRVPEMNSDLPGSTSNRFSPDKLYFIGQCMYFIAYMMTIFGVIGMVIRKFVHSSLDTLPFPTFWVPESFAGAFLTAMLYLFGFGLCWYIKGIERDLRR